MFPVLEKASLRVNSEMTGCMAGGANGRREAQSPSRHPPPQGVLDGPQNRRGLWGRGQGSALP